MKYIRTLIIITLCLTSHLGDFIIYKSKFSNYLVFRALADNSVHGIIGFLSALLFFNSSVSVTRQACLYNTLFCTIMSSVIDIDHFFVARSFYLKDLTNLKERGLFHCTTFWIIITLLLITYSHFTRKLNIYLLTYMVILAFTSHHIQDGNRRGIWLFPYGHTMPLNKFLCTSLICILPIILAYVFNLTKPMFKHNVIEYSEIV